METSSIARPSLRVLTYNIHKGFGVWPGRFVLEIIKSSIQATKADLVFLQEVVGIHHGHADRIAGWKAVQFEYLADSLWPHFAYGKNAVYDQGHHGNAILSRFPILEFDNLDLSLDAGEARGALHCRIEVPFRGIDLPLECFCTHLALSRGGRSNQLKRLCAMIEERSPPAHPLIIAGDFNDWRHDICELFERTLRVRDAARMHHGHVLRTFPSLAPVFALDRIYLRHLAVRSVTTLRGAPWSRLSDHLPVVAEISSTEA